MLRGSDFSDNKKENDAPIPLTIKVKVEVMEEEKTQWTALDGTSELSSHTTSIISLFVNKKLVTYKWTME
jgi:hypothetical protein